MMKLLFFMMPAHGHIQPTLAVARELINRGEKVIYYTTEEFKDKIEKIGAEVRVIDDVFGAPKLDRLDSKADSMKLQETMQKTLSKHAEESHRLFHQVQLENADGIVYDPMCMWGRVIGKQLEFPKILFHSGMIITPDSTIFDYFSTLLDKESLNKIKEIFLVKEELNLSPIPKAFQPESSFLDETYQFIGPTVLPSTEKLDAEMEHLKDRSILYISLGSIINNPTFYETCIDAFANTNWEVIMVAKTIPEKLPTNFTVRPFVSQVDVLPLSQVFISHGGVNSVMESLWFGVPLVLVPHSSDQPIISQRVEDLGLGIKLEMENMTPNLLRETVEKVHSDSVLKKQVAKIQGNLRNNNGAQRGATLIQSFIQKKAKMPNVKGF